MAERVLLITGASRGIGAATARLAAEAGYRLALVARRASSVEPLAAELGADRVLALGADVGEWTEVTAAVERVLDEFGRLDAVFANAGMSLDVSFFGTGGADPGRWHELVRTNVLGPALTARAVLPALADAHGHLVLTGSVAGRYPRKGNLYSATKWAVSGLAAGIREEAVGSGVRVTVVQPGIADTEILNAEQRTKPKLAPEDVARAVLYALAQPPSVDVNEIMLRPTGQVL